MKLKGPPRMKSSAVTELSQPRAWVGSFRALSGISAQNDLAAARLTQLFFYLYINSIL